MALSLGIFFLIKTMNKALFCKIKLTNNYLFLSKNPKNQLHFYDFFLLFLVVPEKCCTFAVQSRLEKCEDCTKSRLEKCENCAKSHL